jgi:CheY-like chemotaxis protein
VSRLGSVFYLFTIAGALKPPDSSPAPAGAAATAVDDHALCHVPAAAFTGRELPAEEDATLHAMARSIVVEGVESRERLLNETSLVLHRIVTALPHRQAAHAQTIEQLGRRSGRSDGLVDDDPRDVFALSSVLERRGMGVLTANCIESDAEVAIVAMDIMMPEMDGYLTIKRIRKSGPFRRLPIIAHTAKAMKGDREKCLEAGASDYLAKPSCRC